MPTYITLYRFTDQGIKSIKEIPGKMQEAITDFEQMGGKVIGVYTVMGDYDVVAVGEAPNDEAAMSFALALGAKGNVRSTTLKAFSKETFAEIVSKLP